MAFLGECSREVTLSALETATQGIGPRGFVDVGLKRWDALANWAAGRERIDDMIGYLYHNRRCGSIEEFHQHRPESAALSNLERLGEAGLWPHVVLPVSQANIRALPDIVLALIEGTRGASIELAPAGF